MQWLAAAIVVSVLAGADVADRDVTIEGKKLHYLEAGDGSRPTVLLLHGARYSSQTWRELGTIDLLVGAGYHVVAIDIPGYGRSEVTPIDREKVLAQIMDTLAIDRASIVSPSMSGAYSLPLVARSPERVSGFIPIAPGAIDQYARALRKVDVDALILWGSEDDIIDVEKSDTLAAALEDSRRHIIMGAGHACYLDNPAEFHQELLGFLAEIDN